MKQILSLLIVSFLTAVSIQALNASSLNISGYMRSGLFADLTDESAENRANKFASLYYDSKHFGGSSKSRFDLKYSSDNGGIFVRHETTLTASSPFSSSTLKRAMAYASFFDNAVIADGGKLYDRFTAQTGDKKSSFGSSLGTRLVLHPADCLYLTAQASDYNPSYNDDGNAKADKNLFSLSAKYTAPYFFLTVAAHLSGIYYGCAGLTAIDNLTLIAEVFCDYGAHYKKGAKLDAAQVHYTRADVWIAYKVALFDFGVAGYVWFAEDEWFSKEAQRYVSFVNPYAKYVFSPLLTLQADGVVYIPRDDGELYATLTPALCFTASKNADATLFLKISSDSAQEHNTAGLGVRYKY